MAIQLVERDDGKILEARVSGKLHDRDYQIFVPEFERLIKQHGKIRVLFDMSQFEGWDAKALWDDIKIDLKHFNDIERIAMVGDQKWQEWMATFCKPFTTAKIRHFEHADAARARAWLEED